MTSPLVPHLCPPVPSSSPDHQSGELRADPWPPVQNSKRPSQLDRSRRKAPRQGKRWIHWAAWGDGVGRTREEIKEGIGRYMGRKLGGGENSIKYQGWE
jgi:hypothetical protein